MKKEKLQVPPLAAPTVGKRPKKTPARSARDAKIPLVPKLRFPKFLAAPEWQTKPLGSLAAISTEKVGDHDCVPMSITSGVGLVSQKEKFGQVIAGNSYKNYLLLKKDDFAYNKSATKAFPEGFIALYTGDALAAVPNSIFTSFRLNAGAAIPQYLNYLFLRNLHGQWLRKFIEVGARAHGSLSIDDEDLLALPVPLPAGKSALTEQKKIADCLGTLHEWISAENQKLDALKAHKNGLMQQLFPREGETLPSFRFPEFQDATDWRHTPLRDVASIVRGGSPRPIDGYLTKQADGLNWLKIGDVDKEAKFVIQTAERVRPEALGKTREVFPGDLILSNSMSFGRPYILTIRTCIHDGWIAVTNLHSEIDRDFLYYAISAPNSQAFFRNQAAGGGVKNLNAEIIKSLMVAWPESGEQQHIASCLSSLDDLIAAQVDQLESLRTFKQGLMQQLFPSLEEAST